MRLAATATLLVVAVTPVLARSTSALGLHDALAAEAAAHPDHAQDTSDALDRGGGLAGTVSTASPAAAGRISATAAPAPSSAAQAPARTGPAQTSTTPEGATSATAIGDPVTTPSASDPASSDDLGTGSASGGPEVGGPAVQDADPTGERTSGSAPTSTSPQTEPEAAPPSEETPATTAPSDDAPLPVPTDEAPSATSGPAPPSTTSAPAASETATPTPTAEPAEVSGQMGFIDLVGGLIDDWTCGAESSLGGGVTTVPDLNRLDERDDDHGMPIAAKPVPYEVPPQLDLRATAASSLLPTRATLIDRLAERTPSSDVAPATLVLVGLLRRDNGWPLPGAHLDRVAAALSADVRGSDWLARSGPSEFAVVLDSAGHHAEIAANRLLQVVADAGVPGLTACAGIAGLSPDAAPTEVHRRATLCLTAARSVGGGRVIRYSGARR